jgi:hypothetical protein
MGLVFQRDNSRSLALFQRAAEIRMINASVSDKKFSFGPAAS